MDIGGAVILGLLLAPVLLAVYLLVLLTMGRPVFFRQRRVGQHGKIFEVRKFRTMYAEQYSGQADAARTSTVGRLLRASSLDELPQLWNVLRGEMSLIGPRPTLPEQVAWYSDRQRGRLAVRPGLTGWAQVNGRNSIGWPERIELDLWYIENRCLALDVQILGRTVKSVLSRRGIVGAGGVNPGFPTPRSQVDIALGTLLGGTVTEMETEG